MVIIIAVLGSCNKENIDPGIIIQELNLKMCGEFYFAKTYIFTTDSAFQTLLNEPSCDNIIDPTIDFNQFSLLGMYASGGCKVTFKPQVLKDEQNKKYKFTVFVFEKGLCKKAAISNNWVLVPKLPLGYSVDFEVKNE